MIKLEQLTSSAHKCTAGKALLKLDDGNNIETVLIKHQDRYTACLSTQVGCPLKCAFCATGQGGFIRNLTAAEIVEQIVFWNTQLVVEKQRVNNVVLMGMGEPFLNWENVKESLRIINSPKGLKIGQRKISLSTCGIIDKIGEFANENTQINLAISLHSAVAATRSRLMPVNQIHPLNKLIPACLNYVEKARRKLFFEYTLLAGINDTEQEIAQVAKLIRKHDLFHLNLIPYNSTKGDFKPTGKRRLKEIMEFLDNHKVAYTVRKSFGADINAACGQLKSMEQGNASGK